MKVVEKFKKLYLHDSTLKGIYFDFSGEKVNLILDIDLLEENKDLSLEEFNRKKELPKFIKVPSMLTFINCIKFIYDNENIVVNNIIDSNIYEDTPLLKESTMEKSGKTVNGIFIPSKKTLKDKFYHFTIGLYPMELQIIAKDFELRKRVWNCSLKT